MNYSQIDRTNCLEIILQNFPAFSDSMGYVLGVVEFSN